MKHTTSLLLTTFITLSAASCSWTGRNETEPAQTKINDHFAWKDMETVLTELGRPQATGKDTLGDRIPTRVFRYEDPATLESVIGYEPEIQKEKVFAEIHFIDDVTGSPKVYSVKTNILMRKIPKKDAKLSVVSLSLAAGTSLFFILFTILYLMISRKNEITARKAYARDTEQLRETMGALSASVQGIREEFKVLKKKTDLTAEILEGTKKELESNRQKKTEINKSFLKEISDAAKTADFEFYSRRPTGRVFDKATTDSLRAMDINTLGELLDRYPECQKSKGVGRRSMERITGTLRKYFPEEMKEKEGKIL